MCKVDKYGLRLEPIQGRNRRYSDNAPRPALSRQYPDPWNPSVKKNPPKLKPIGLSDY